MRKSIWRGRKWEKVDMCENGARNNDINFGRGIGVLQCYDNPVTTKATVFYHENESDSMNLCDECIKNLKKSARKNGYRVKTERIK